MKALVGYSNGSLHWPEGMSANWLEGEERIVPDSLWEAIMRDGAGKFDVKFYRPEPPVVLDPSDGIQPDEATAAGEALAQYAREQATEPEPAAVNKRAAALEKARAVKAAKAAAAKADKE